MWSMEKKNRQYKTCYKTKLDDNCAMFECDAIMAKLS